VVSKGNCFYIAMSDVTGKCKVNTELLPYTIRGAQEFSERPIESTCLYQAMKKMPPCPKSN
jgi:hypothetical protein